MFAPTKLTKISKNLLKWLGKSLTRVAVAILSIIGFITSIISFIQLFLGNRQILIIVFIILGALGWLAILGGLAHISFSKRDKKVGRRHFRVHKFDDHLLARQWLLILTILTAITIAGIASFTYYKDQELRSKTIVLLTNFKGSDPENYLVNEKLYRQLHESLKDYPDVLIQSTEESINEQDDRQIARNLGNLYRADLMLWGYYGVTGSDVLITIHIENFSSFETVPLSSSTTSEMYAPVAQIESFQIQQKLANQMTALVYFITGITRFQNYEYDKAIKLFTAGLNSPDWAEQVLSRAYVLDFRAESYKQIGKLKEAKSDLNDAINLQPSNPKFYVDRGNLLRNLGDWEQGLADINKALEIDPNLYEAYINRSYIYYDLGKFDEALSDLNFAIQLKPNLVNAYDALAWYYYQRGYNQQAIEEISKAINIDKKRSKSYNSRAKIYINIGEYELAIKDLNYAIKLDPTNPEYSNNRGVAYSYLGEVQRSCDDHLKAVQLGLDDLASHFNLAQCYRDQGLIDKEIEEYSKSIELGFETTREKELAHLVYFYRAEAYIKSGKPKYREKAVSDYRQAYMLTSDDEIHKTIEAKLRSLNVTP